MLIKTPYIKLKKVEKQPNVFDIAGSFQQIAAFADELQALKNEHKKTLEEQAQDFEKLINTKEQELSDVLQHILSIQKGEQGEKPIAGIDYPIPKDGKDAVVDESAIEERIAKRIKQPKDGKDAIIDYVKIAKLATKFIKTSEIDEDKITENVLENIKKKKLLKTEHISNFTDGMEQTIAPIRSLAAGFRGGGDTVSAGSGISISSSGGVKTISVTNGLTELPATGTIDDSNVTFTFTQKPSYIVINGAWKKENDGWTWAVLTATLTYPVGTRGSIFGIA